MPPTSRIPVYIAGPYAAATPEERAENVRRIGAVSRWAVENGYAPVSVHAAIEAGHLGEDDDPVARERGIEVSLALVDMVAHSHGELFVIERDDKTLSTGSEREVRRFGRPPTIRGTWANWERTWANDEELLSPAANR